MIRLLDPSVSTPTTQAVDNWATMGDAEFPTNLNGTSFQIVGGYLVSPEAANPWDEADWRALPGYKLPIFVANFNGRLDAESALGQLESLGVPKGCVVAYDMETRQDVTCVASFGAVMQHHSYKVWVYGSASTVFGNPKLNGYWVADYAGIGPFMYRHPGTRATQWTDGPKFDQSTVKPWELSNLWK